MQSIFRAILLVLLVGSIPQAAAFEVGDNFATDPLGPGSPWSFGVGGNSSNQFSYDAAGLKVHVDSSLPTARFDMPLGTTLDDSSSFLLSARFSFHITAASPFQFAQFAFGLTNTAFTGGDRTGSFANAHSDNTYHTVEFDYFPNVSPSFGGPTLQPTVFGGPIGEAFDNFQSIPFGDGNLGDNAPDITELPQDTLLEAQLAYNGSAKTLTLSMYTVAGDNSLTTLATHQAPLDLNAFPFLYDSSNPFLLDTLSIMAYNDGYTSSEDPSLVADVTYRGIHLAMVPEPSGALLLTVAMLAIGLLRRRAR